MTRLPANTSAVRADITDSESLEAALKGCDVAFYLVHSMGEDIDFSRLEMESAETFARVAQAVGLRRIIYLGALAQADPNHTSVHIESRHRVGEILRSTGVPVTEFRASVIIGSGSMPFEVIRSLVERLPVMVTPRWVRMPVQPIAAVDLARYLVAAVTRHGAENHIYEVGGAEVTTYSDLMQTYARVRGLRRYMVPVPVVTPRLSSLWLKLITPAHYRIGRRIVDSAAHSSVVVRPGAKEDFGIEPLGVEDAIRAALNDENESLGFLDESAHPEKGIEKFRHGTKFVERRSVLVSAGEGPAFEVLSRVGGPNGWFWGTWLWKLRGGVDRMFGGPGLRADMTRFPPEAGAVLDFWTVVRVTNRRLTLRADMKLPGEAWLDLAVRSDGGKTYVDQTAAFDPRGLAGILYWFALYPMHSLVFSGMSRGIKRAVNRGSL